MNTRMYLEGRQSQNGATLIVALVVLLIMGVTSASILQSTTLQHKMTTNMVDNAIAFHAAEDALVDLEGWLQSNTASLTVVNYSANISKPASSAVYSVDDTTSDTLKGLIESTVSNDFQKWKGLAFSVKDYTGIDELSSVAGETQVTIEKLSVSQYRIIVRNTGASDRAEVILESTIIL